MALPCHRAPAGPGFAVQDPVTDALLQRSAALTADPKAAEIEHFVGSHSHQRRLKTAAGLNSPEVVPTSLEQHVRVLRRIEAEEGNADNAQPVGSCASRLSWRSEMDRNLKRLMQETELALDDRFSSIDKARLRCSQLDKTYEWFEKHGKKEASKERQGPAYLRFDTCDRAMPGSLRGSQKFGLLKPQTVKVRPQSPGRRTSSSLRAVASQTLLTQIPPISSLQQASYPQLPAPRPEYNASATTRDTGKWMP